MVGGVENESCLYELLKTGDVQTHRTQDEEHLYNLESDSPPVILFSYRISSSQHQLACIIYIQENLKFPSGSIKVPILHLICLRMDESTRV